MLAINVPLQIMAKCPLAKYPGFILHITYTYTHSTLFFASAEKPTFVFIYIHMITESDAGPLRAINVSVHT